MWPWAAPEPWLRGVSDPYDGAAGNPNHQWTVALSAQAAAGRLRSLVRGRLIGVRTRQHGASPRIVRAEVIGTGGNTEVSGSDLQRRLGLLSVPAQITTITSQTGRPAAASDIGHAAHASSAVTALVSLVHQLVAGVVPALSGTVVPAAPGQLVTVQAQRHGAWEAVARVRLDQRGAFTWPVPSAGLYRVVVRGLNGPAVRVS